MPGNTELLTLIGQYSNLILSFHCSSHNTYSHNIVRDALVVVAGHWTWAVLSSILAASVLGMASVQVLSHISQSQ